MMRLHIDDKRKIAARLFFVDNRDVYDCFQDALDEFKEGKQSDPFIDAVVAPVLSQVEGHVLLMSPDGHVATLRLSDYFFAPRTIMIEEEGDALEKQFKLINDENPDDDELELLKKMGWKRISPTPAKDGECSMRPKCECPDCGCSLIDVPEGEFE